MGAVRKISVQMDKDNMIHYQVNRNVFGGTKVISDIIKEGQFFDIYAKNSEDDTIIKWKSFNESIVAHIEYETEV